MTDVQATGKASSPQKRNPALQFMIFFHFFCGTSRLKSMRIADPCEFGSTTLVTGLHGSNYNLLETSQVRSETGLVDPHPQTNLSEKSGSTVFSKFRFQTCYKNKGIEET
jgi:hypothetical protein